MVKKVAVIALDPRASAFYGKQVQELFGEYVKVILYSVREGNDFRMGRRICLMSTDAFDNREDVPSTSPLKPDQRDSRDLSIWETIQLAADHSCGTRAVCEYDGEMVPEATSGLNQLGVNHIAIYTLLSGERSRWRHWPGCHTGLKNGMSRTA